MRMGWLVFALAAAVAMTAVTAQAAAKQQRAAELERRIQALCAVLPDNPNCRGRLEARCESDDGDVCVCGPGKVCEATETTCGCFKTEDAGVGGRPVLGFSARPQPPSKATIDVKCGADVYTISTGTDGGQCQATPPGSAGGGGGSCTDGAGNGANVSCDTGCTSASGAGSCTGP